jgi:cytochrome c oxidase subunit 4
MLNSHAVMSKHVKAYVRVFVALGLLTVLTALASRIDFHGDWNIVTALAIAAIKASLVAAVFMHLKWERAAAIWSAVALSVAFFLALIVLAVLTMQDLPAMTKMGTWG